MAFITPTVDSILVLNDRLTADPSTGYKVLDYIRSKGNLPVRVTTWHVVYLFAFQSPGSTPDGCFLRNGRRGWCDPTDSIG